MFSLSNLCFLCLNSSNNLKPILIENNEGIFVQKQLKYCLPEMDIDFFMELPKNICSNCTSTLEYLYKFKQTCLQNNTYLKNYMQTLKSTNESNKHLSVKPTDLKYQNKPQALSSDQALPIIENELRTGENEDNGIFIKDAQAPSKHEIMFVDVLNIEGSHSNIKKENEICVEEEFFTPEDNVDDQYVKSIKCETVTSDSDVSISRIEDVQGNSKYSNCSSENNSAKSKEDQITLFMNQGRYADDNVHMATVSNSWDGCSPMHGKRKGTQDAEGYVEESIGPKNQISHMITSSVNISGEGDGEFSTSVWQDEGTAFNTSVQSTTGESSSTMCETEKINVISDDILMSAKKTTEVLIPTKSKASYDKEFKIFVDWKMRNGLTVVNETAMITYFQELSDKYTPNSLWTKYSILKSALIVNYNVDISSFTCLVPFLKKQLKGYTPKKSKVLTGDQVLMFIKNAPNEKHLLHKKMKPGGKPLSFIWNFFHRVSEKGKINGKCKFCSKQYVTHVDRMAKHLTRDCVECPLSVKVKIQEKYKRANYSTKNSLKTKRDDCDASSSTSKDPSVEFGSSDEDDEVSEVSMTLNNTKTMQSKVYNVFDKMSKNEQIELEEILAQIFYFANLPFKLVENSYFINFFNKLRPSFTLPSRKQLSGTFLDVQVSKIKKQIQDVVAECEQVAIASDGWSNLRNESVINYMVLNPKPMFYKYILSKDVRHTKEYIAEQFSNVIHEIGSDKVAAIVTDNAANMSAAWELLKKEFPKLICYGCGAHCLQLLFNDIEKLPSFNTHVVLCKEIITFFKNKKPGAVLCQKFKVAGTQKSTLSLPCSTKWASTFTSLKDLHASKQYLKQAVVEYSVANVCPKRIKDNILDDEIFWKLTSSYIKLLEPVKDAIDIIQSDLSIISETKHHFQKIKTNFKNMALASPLNTSDVRKIIEYAEFRCSCAVIDVHIAAYILDPRYCGAGLDEDEVDVGCKVISNFCGGQEDEAIILSEVALLRSKSGRFGRRIIWESVKAFGKKNNFAPIDWWTGFCENSVLLTAAKKLLQLPASPERNWSIWAVHSKLRNRLDAKRAGDLVYVYHNLRLLKGMHSDNDYIDYNEPELELKTEIEEEMI